MRRFALLLALLFALPSAADHLAAPIPAAEALFKLQPRPEALDGRLQLLYSIARDEQAWRMPMVGNSVDARGVSVTIRFDHDASASELASVEAMGCKLNRLPSGRIAVVGPVTEGRCDWTAFAKLLELPSLVRVSPTFGGQLVRPSMPDSHVAKDIEVVALRNKLHPLKGRGTGVLIGDMDSGIDPFHPMFFRPDGGFYAWIDVNHDGVFQPLTDAVDMNGNGVADPGETLGVIKAVLRWDYGNPPEYQTTEPFAAGVDWLFQDENGNGTRDYGKIFGDAKPTFGEQLFVADDVNKNGVLDVGEKVVRLNTPKIKSVLVYPANGGSPTEYKRGVNLSQITNTRQGDEMHGTMVNATMVGSDPAYMKYAGMAPDAEVVLATTSAQSLVAPLAWAREQGAHLVLWEMATWYWESLDGSSNHEVACDAASDQGVPQIGAAGNLGGSDKHNVNVIPTGTTTLPLEVPAGMAHAFWGNLNWRGSGSQLSIAATVNGVKVQLSQSASSAYAGSATIQWTQDTSPRGTNMLMFSVYQQSAAFSGQTVQFEVTNSGAPVTLHGYVSDDFTSWNKGIYWSTGATDFGTYGTPGTGDKTLSVGTMFRDFVPQGESSTTLASWSGKGPRIDGADSVNVVVPEDHVTAYSYYGALPLGTMMVGGGTSNASPTFVGMLALMKELHPTDSSAQLEARMLSNTETNPSMGSLPNDSWGSGMGRVYRAEYSGALPVSSQPPVARGTILWTSTNELSLDARSSSDPENGALQYRWDLNYDGNWDILPSATAQQTAPGVSVPFAKLEVFDPEGQTSQVLVAIPPNPNGSGGGSGGGSGHELKILPAASTQLGAPLAGCGCGAAELSGPFALLCIGALRMLRRRRAR